MKKMITIVLAVAALAFTLPPAAQAAIDLPTAVGPYRVLFVTSMNPTADATVTMAELNAWVTVLAVASGLDAEAGRPGWYVLGATSTVDVFANTGLTQNGGVPIYLPTGVLFAADNANAWSIGAAGTIFDTNEYGVFGDSGTGSWTHTGLAYGPITAVGNELDAAAISMAGKDAGYNSWYGSGAHTWADGIDNGSILAISGVIDGPGAGTVLIIQ